MLPTADQPSESAVRAFADAHPDLSYITFTPELTVLGWNAGAERLFGWTRREAVGRLILDVTVPDDMRPELFANDSAHVALEGDFRSRRVEADNVHREGRRFAAESWLFPVAAGSQVT